MAELAPPPRGTRPRNRRALIVASAAPLFADRGYDQVSMGDIAAAVGIGPSALYRHFSGKQELLREVVCGGIAPIRDLVTDVDLRDPRRALRSMASAGLDERHLGVLWQREARHLEEPARSSAYADLHSLYKALMTQVRAARPDLNVVAAGVLATTIASVLGSPSFHHVEIARPAFDDLLAELACTVLESPLREEFPAPVVAGARNPPPFASRREALLAEAIRLFAADGYAAVGNDDIAAAVGIVGPSIYNHFGSKAEILNAALRRGTEAIFTELSAAYRFATDAPDALRRLVRSYVEFTSTNHDLIGLLISEWAQLPSTDPKYAREVQREFVDEWVHLFRLVHPDAEPAVARVRVHAVLTVSNNAARSVTLRRNPAALAAIESIGTRLLDLPAAEVMA